MESATPNEHAEHTLRPLSVAQLPYYYATRATAQCNGQLLGLIANLHKPVISLTLYMALSRLSCFGVTKH